MRLVFFCFIIFVLTGCAKLTHLPQLLTLKAYGDNKDEQKSLVEAQDKNFDKLLKAVRQNEIVQFQTKQEFLDHFGEPIFRRESSCQDAVCQEWLYRYATEYFDADKVYVYFDKDGHVVDWKYVQSSLKEKEPGDE